MQAKLLKKKYLEFFKKKEHAVIHSGSLIPEHDPTVLFTTAGMHPLVPFLMGQKHPSGKRLVDVQKCIRTGDIEEVGDTSHLTFFEMLGNWSLGDYFKKEAIEWSIEFLIKVLGFDIKDISVTVFAGDKNAPRDKESAGIWKSLGIPEERIYYLPKEDNWWGPAGATGPCGPCTEMFIDIGKRKCSPECKPGCSCGKYFEIWNDVFMEYNKLGEGKFEKLKQQNVDTGMGVERTATMLQGKDNVYETELFVPIINEIKKLANVNNFSHEQTRSLRIIADHMKAATFILGDERAVTPSNLDQGYILRRLIRRGIRHARLLGIKGDLCRPIAKIVIDMYKDEYPEFKEKKKFIMDELLKEEERFSLTLEKGLKKFEIIAAKGDIDGKQAFLLFQSYGFPFEMVRELANERAIKVDEAGFNKEFKKHQELSRKGAEQRFKGGLSEASDITAKLHTATHILGKALRKVLKNKEIKQKGSNITPERLRYDFNFERKLTPKEIKYVEDEVNKVIKKGIEVKKQEMDTKKAISSGAQAEFGAKYPPKVWVYSIGSYTKDICMGPHVENTSELGHFKIIKEESSAAGVRRIKAVLD
ncbi:alanine--tRNA ligase [Candidatus Woesearchaeota archaeon]|nr:alanine--tRNA ligase [Candidatus Woesearchaeota archaeon]|tara:strand:- start:13857 stop:15620 length:1764 start_codon:yes stop_codon:yes gene_type:complete